jgi:hypothetical protein
MTFSVLFADGFLDSPNPVLLLESSLPNPYSDIAGLDLATRITFLSVSLDDLFGTKFLCTIGNAQPSLKSLQARRSVTRDQVALIYGLKKIQLS